MIVTFKLMFRKYDNEANINNDEELKINTATIEDNAKVQSSQNAD